MASQTILHYRIIRKIGAGGMGEVYLAEDTRLGRRVALKLLRRDLINDEHRVLRFKQEARAASALNHPNILTIYDIGETDSAHFIATEFVNGETLRNHLATARLAWRETVDIVSHAASALASAHKVGIVHRDIKPDNIMIRSDGLVKVVDFGLAKLTERKGSSNDSESPLVPLVNTEAGLVMGTPNYMSPEQVRGFDVDGRSDIFSLGAVLYEMLAGRPPFQGQTVSDIIAAILQKRPSPIAQYAPDAPIQLQRILTKALQKDAQERYQEMLEMMADLNGLKQQSENTEQEDTVSIAADNKANTLITSGPVIIDTPQNEELHTTKILQNSSKAESLIGKITLTMKQPSFIIAASSMLIIALLTTAHMVGLWPNRINKILPSLQSFEFDTVLLDSEGNIAKRHRNQAKQFNENLDGGVTLEMVEVPAGTFLMGASESEICADEYEKPQHLVNLSTFFIGKFEVTQSQWRAVARLPKVSRDLVTDPSEVKGDDLPVEQVSWEDAIEFCERLSLATGHKYRLPSEAEWEYACRAGTTTAFAFGEMITLEVANFSGTYVGNLRTTNCNPPESPKPKGRRARKTTPVGSYGFANALGLYDMHGNVEEWTLDMKHPGYNGAPSNGSPWLSTTNLKDRMVRGGSYVMVGKDCRCASRAPIPITENGGGLLGFRVVIGPEW